MLLAVLAQTLTIFTAEPQLNTSAFAGCLARRGAQIDQIPIWPDLTAIRREHGLSHRDGLLLYLALYANRRTSCLNATETDAFERWAMPFEMERRRAPDRAPEATRAENYEKWVFTTARRISIYFSGLRISFCVKHGFKTGSESHHRR